jgi:hypothetical protein
MPGHNLPGRCEYRRLPVLVWSFDRKTSGIVHVTCNFHHIVHMNGVFRCFSGAFSCFEREFPSFFRLLRIFFAFLNIVKLLISKCKFGRFVIPCLIWMFDMSICSHCFRELGQHLHIVSFIIFLSQSLIPFLLYSPLALSFLLDSFHHNTGFTFFSDHSYVLVVLIF